MIVKRNLNPVKVAQLVWQPAAYALGIAVAAVLARRQLGPGIAVPFLPVGTVGAAAAIFVAFRNNASYARWWEARTLWGTIHSSCRVFARQVGAATQNAVAVAQAAGAEPSAADGSVPAALAFRREMVLRLVALAHATRLQLRGERDWSVLAPLLPEQEHRALRQAHNRPNMLLQTMAERVKYGVRAGILGQFDPISLEPTLGALNSAIASCERLKDTPTPRQYDYFTRMAVLVFVTLLPFGLLQVMPPAQDLALIVLATATATIYIVLEVVGAVVEAPFAGRNTDVPLTYLCGQIERDLREQLGDSELPAPVTPRDGYLW